MDMKIQRLKVLLNKIYTGADQRGLVSKSDYFESGRYAINPLWGQREYANLNTGDFFVENEARQPLKASKKRHVAFGVRINMQPVGNVSSHIEMIFAEGIEPLLDGLNANSMDHFIFYVIYEINEKGGRLVKILKADLHDIVSDMAKHSWHDVVSALTVLKGYPLGILNIQPTHTASSNADQTREKASEKKNTTYMCKPSAKKANPPPASVGSVLATLDLLKSSQAA